MEKRKVLFILTNHDELGPDAAKSAGKTGFHLSEAAEPWAVLTDAGFEVDLATPRGGKAPIDPSSRDLGKNDNVRFLNDARVMPQLAVTKALDDVSLGDYDAIYFPGGHGTMWDLPEADNVQKAIREVYEDGKIIAAVCHGPAAFVNVKLSNGDWLVKDKTISVFTDAEERAVEKDKIVPFMLASKLEERGAKLKSADNFNASVSVDQRLVTGQNPASAKGVGEAIRDEIKSKLKKAA